MSQRRMDLDVRPELRLGSVDFVVNREYWVQDNASSAGGRGAPRQPTPLHYIFAIDVSWSSVRCGLVKEVTESLKALLFPPAEEDGPDGEPGLPGRSLPAGAKVGIVTFDRTVQFYNLRVRLRSFPFRLPDILTLLLFLQPGLEKAQMLVVPDIDDMFLPLGPESFLVDPLESRCALPPCPPLQSRNPLTNRSTVPPSKICSTRFRR